MQIKQRSGLIPVTVPNWRSPVSIDYEFKTSLFTAHDGSEQREALRQNARVALNFNVVLTEAGVQRHLGDLAKNQDSLLVLPFGWWKIAISGVAGAVVTVAEVPFWLVAGATIVLDNGPQQEAATVASVSGNDITLDAAPGYTFTAGSALMRAEMVRAQDKVTFQAQTDNLFEGSIKYTVNPGGPSVHAAISPAQFEGRDIWAQKPDWRSRPRISLASSREDLDFGRGVVASYNPVTYHRRQLQLGYMFPKGAGVEEFVAFFARQQGKRGSFWMPTWTNDITVRSATASTIEVEGTEVAEAFEGSSVYNVLYHAGQANRIDTYEIIDSGTATRINMIDPWAAVPSPGKGLSWCPRWRWATDKLTVQWITNEVAEVQTTFDTLPNEAP